MNEPCRRYGVIGTDELAERPGVKEHDWKLDHTVPTGQQTSTPVHIFDSTSIRVAGCEDKNEGVRRTRGFFS
jgi:hypothetical protein